MTRGKTLAITKGHFLHNDEGSITHCYSLVKDAIYNDTYF